MSEFKERNFKCSIDLLNAARKQLKFLQTVDFYSLLKDENSDIIKGAIIRYEKFWLPLVANNDTQNLVPPLDVEWIWHCHLLSPYSYREDCLNIFGKVLYHRVEVPGDKKLLWKNSKKIWEAAYPYEPFHVELNVNEIHCCTVDFKSRISYDLVAAVSRQKKFYYQVALPHNRDGRFLEEAIRRYKMFLYLKQIYPEVFLVPFYDIDLIWHSHQVHPIEYHDDTSKILGGRMLNHDDTTTDRNLGSVLYTSDLETRNLWRKAFGKEIAIYGTMFRGDPPENKLHYLNRENMLQFCDTKTTIKFTNVNFDFERPESFPQEGKFKVKISVISKACSTKIASTQNDDVMAEGPRPNWNKSQLYFQTIDFNTSFQEQLVFQFFHSKQRFFKRSNLFLGSLTYNFSERRLHPQHMQEYADNSTHEFMFLQQLDACKNGYDHVIVSGEMTVPEIDRCFLKLIPSTFASANMPPNLESLWGPVPMSILPDYEDNICDVAEHKLMTVDGDTKFTCRVIHSVKLLTSVIHVFFDDKMASVAHLIGTNQLPVTKQIRNKSSIYLNSSKRERAVLIKNHAGDWGIVIGRWTGFKKGMPSPGRGIPAVQGCPGFLDISFRKLSKTGQVPLYEHLSMKGLLEHQEVFELQNVRINIKLGHILVKGGHEVAENVCLAFVLSLLHVLCVPRPVEWKPGQTLDTESSFRGTKPITIVPSSDMAFFMAAGLLVTSPCNHFIWNTYGNNACAGCSGGDIGEVDNDLTEHGYANSDNMVNIGNDGGGCGGCGAGCGSQCGGTDGGDCGSSCGGDCGGGCGGGCGGD